MDGHSYRGGDLKEKTGEGKKGWKKQQLFRAQNLFFGTTFQVECNMMFIYRAINLITKITVNLG